MAIVGFTPCRCARADWLIVEADPIALARGGAERDAETAETGRLGTHENGCVRKKVEYRNQIWRYDFTMDQAADGKRLNVDEYTRECLANEVERSMTART